jgi:large subunit ribosomal protein L1
MAQRIVDQTVSIEDINKSNKSEKESVENQDNNNQETKTTKKKTKGSKQKKKRGINYKSAKKGIDKDKSYQLEEAVKIIKSKAYANFNESIEIHVNLGIDPQNSDQRIRFTTSLPHGIGKEIKILVISDDNSGVKENVIYRDASVIDEILKGKFSVDKDFNVVVSTPKFMKDIAKVARILGPKGLMPSPKNNTVSEDPTKVLKDLSQGQIEIKSQSGHAVMHQIVGNLKFKDEQLVENIQTLIADISKNQPSKLKKKLIQKVYICSSMGPSIRLSF